MKLLFMCGREVDYTRNQVILRALKRIVNVDTVVESEHAKSLFLRSIKISLRSIPKYIFSKYDAVFVGFYGHLLMLPAGLLIRKPIIFDAFVSTYDTLTSDRMSFAAGSFRGKLAAYLDRVACRMADTVLLDTPGQVKYFSESFGISSEKLYSIPVSCNEEIFYPRLSNGLINGISTVLSYSSYLPLHGVDTIIRAAEILKNEPIRFKLIGSGPEHQSVVTYAHNAGLENVSFLAPIPLNALSDEIAVSDICLGGHFGVSDKAKRVIPGKIYQMLAMQKAVIAADSPANKEFLEHGVSAYLCPPKNPAELAKAIHELHINATLRSQIAIGGRFAYEKYGSEAIVTEKLRQILSKIETHH